MKDKKFLNVLILCLGGLFYIVGSIASKTNRVYSTTAYITSSLLFIIWSIIYIVPGKSKWK